ncbi:hypothetical protein MPER_10210, partial [Moniliophthora perniciosa FA553]
LFAPSPDGIYEDQSVAFGYVDELELGSLTQIIQKPSFPEYLQQELGGTKWSLFSAKLTPQRRATQPRSKAKPYTRSNPPQGANVIDYLVKAEVVKEVLYKYVSSPDTKSYNRSSGCANATPLNKPIYADSCRCVGAGWLDAITTFASHDTRLRNIGIAIQKKLREYKIFPLTLSSFQSSTPSADHTESLDPEDYSVMQLTGRNLDTIIDKAKKQTGQSKVSGRGYTGWNIVGSQSMQELGDSCYMGVIDLQSV